jgi:hypothetical protein
MNAQFRARKPKAVMTVANRTNVGKEERRQRRGASGAPVVEKRTERGQGALLGLVGLVVFSPEILLPVPSGIGHKRSYPFMIDHVSAVSITKTTQSRSKVVLMRHPPGQSRLQE